MQASLNPGHRSLPTYVPVNGFQERGSSCRVAQPQAMQMALEESGLNEIDYCELRHTGTTRVEQGFEGAHRLHQTLWDH
jgi:hypothetical protein